jgi:hypothetical protein
MPIATEHQAVVINPADPKKYGVRLKIVDWSEALKGSPRRSDLFWNLWSCPFPSCESNRSASRWTRDTLLSQCHAPRSTRLSSLWNRWGLRLVRLDRRPVPGENHVAVRRLGFLAAERRGRISI